MIWVGAGCTAGVDVSAEGVEVGVPVTPEAPVAPDVLLTAPAASVEPGLILVTPSASVEPDLVLVAPSAPVEPDFVPTTPVELEVEAPLTVIDPDTLDADPLVESEAAVTIGTVVDPEALSVAPDLEAVTLGAAEPEPVVAWPPDVVKLTCPDCAALATCEISVGCDVSPERVICEAWDVPVAVEDNRLGSEPLGRARVSLLEGVVKGNTPPDTEVEEVALTPLAVGEEVV